MKNLIFISKGAPNAIKSAGDIRSLRMLSILRNEYEIDVLSNSADYGVGDVKGLGCIPHLTGNFQNTITEILNIKKIDAFVISHWRIANPIIDFIRSKTNVPIIIDTIDLEYVRIEREFTYKNTIEKMKNEVEKIKKAELDTYVKADYLISITEFENQELLKWHNFRLTTLPCIYEINKSSLDLKSNNAYTVCNWMHEPNITATAYLCEKIIPNVNVNFYIIGKHPPEQIKQFDKHNRVNVCGAEYEMNKFLSRVTICLAPILYGAGMNGKIGEALAFGIPVVTTELGAKPWNLVHRESVIICKSDIEFINCIQELLTNEQLRNGLSVNGKKIMEKFTVTYWKTKFLEVMKQWVL